MTKYKKLVRDNIPDIIQASGKTPITYIATHEEYEKALLDKLSEEVSEFRESESPDELADILEVVDAICEFRGLEKDELQQIKETKAKKRGKFSKRIILDSVE